jgi:hypothetical protein
MSTLWINRCPLLGVKRTLLGRTGVIVSKRLAQSIVEAGLSGLRCTLQVLLVVQAYFRQNGLRAS